MTPNLSTVEVLWAAKKLRLLEEAPLTMAEVISDFTDEETEDIEWNAARPNSSGIENCTWGAIGEYGLRKYLVRYGLDLIQNHTRRTQQFYYDWSGELRYVEVKSQVWHSKDFVLKGDKFKNYFYIHRAKVQYVLTWGQVPKQGGRIFVGPFALMDVAAIDAYIEPLHNGSEGFAVNYKRAYDGGFLIPLNSSWFNKAYNDNLTSWPSRLALRERRVSWPPLAAPASPLA